MKVYNKVIIVSGGGNGMGREIVLNLLSKGAKVIAIDINETALQETAAMANGEKLGSQNNFDVDTTSNAEWFNEDSLKKYAAVVFMSTTGDLLNHYQEVVDEAAEGGVSYLVCASTPITTLEEIKSSIAVLNKTAEAAQKAGLQFAYHNHDAEFKTIEGVVPYELFLSETDPKLMRMELDIAWAVKGGTDPVALFQKHPGRFPLWHVKDLDAERKTVLPVGKGTIDYRRIFKAASTAGMQYYFVEHDMPADAFASIKESINNIRKIAS